MKRTEITEGGLYRIKVGYNSDALVRVTGPAIKKVRTGSVYRATGPSTTYVFPVEYVAGRPTWSEDEVPSRDFIEAAPDGAIALEKAEQRLTEAARELDRVRSDLMDDVFPERHTPAGREIVPVQYWLGYRDQATLQSTATVRGDSPALGIYLPTEVGGLPCAVQDVQVRVDDILFRAGEKDLLTPEQIETLAEARRAYTEAKEWVRDVLRAQVTA